MQRYVTFVEKESYKSQLKKNYSKARDHCHFTVKYTDASHSICNLNFNMPDKVPVVFHSGSNYDDHFIIK